MDNHLQNNIVEKAEIPFQPEIETQPFEEPEGLDKSGSVDWGDYPIDSVLIRSDPRSVYEVVRRIKANNYILDPDFQRDFVWDEVKQSRLIESALMRIPLPVFYLAEQADGKIVVVDGLQRLMTFYRYLENQFALKGLSGAGAELNGKKFDELLPKYQNRIEDTNLILYLIDSKVPERARLDIFERVNSGVPLSRQQMRNCLYVGQATRWLKEQAGNQWFLKATDRSLDPKPMRDRELINRFCGFFLLGVDSYRGDMDDFLAKALQHMAAMESKQLDDLAKKFQGSMKNSYMIFGRQSFRKHTSPYQRRSVINAALFDVFSVLMARYEESDVNEKATSIREKFYSLIVNEDFSRAITLSTNSRNRVVQRFEMVTRAFQGI